MLSKETIENNKLKFLDIFHTIQRDGMDMEFLEKQLLYSDFFTAPASTKFHGSYEGGLCEHCLKVYDNLTRLVNEFEVECDENTVKILGLFHDFSKLNFYKKSIQNKKIYSDGGSKHDNLGNFDWVSVPIYTVRDPEDRFVFGNHENTAAYMISSFIPLTTEEYCAIIHHHGGMGWDSSKENLDDIYRQYPICMYLHIADLIDAYTTANE